MRHVFPNREIPHLWAHQTQDHARNGTGSFYFRGATIYSYGSHFPIATHVKGSQGQPGILFTSQRNSVTTTQHKSAVNRSIPPDVPVFTVPYQHLGFSEAEDKYQHERNLAHYVREVADNLSTCARARSSWKKEHCHERAVELRKEALCYATFFGLPDPPIEMVPDMDSEQMVAIKAREAQASAKKAAETKRKQEEDRVRWQETAEQWRRGEYHHYLPFDLPTMLRIEGHEVVTSRGARFPITHAKRGLALVRAVIARGEDWRRNGRSCHLGHYSIDWIEANGTVHAGCHIVTWNEIERIASEIEEYEPRIKCTQCQMLSINGVPCHRSDFSATDLSWMEAIVAQFPVRVPPREKPAVVGIDAILQAAYSEVASVENVRVLCGCAAFSDTLEIRRAIRNRFYQLTPQEQRELRKTKLSSALLDDLLESSGDKAQQAVPESWLGWLTVLKATPYWPKAIEIARKGATEWAFMDGDPEPEDFTKLLLDVQERTELRVSLPHLITCARTDVNWPRPEWVGFYETVMDILANYTEGSVDDLTVWAELMEILLQLGVSKVRYQQICKDVTDLWRNFASAAALDWALEVIDNLIFYPCPDDSTRNDVFFAVASRAQSFKRLLENRQSALLRLFASDLLQPDWVSAFAVDPEITGEVHSNPFATLDGKMVAIYSLTERVSKRVKSILETFCPTVDVRTNADHVGSAVLKKLAKEADIFVVNTASAKHAATDSISAHRRTGGVTLYHNSRGTQSMLALLEANLRDRTVTSL